MPAHHTDVCGAWGVGVNGVRWPESVWTKTAVSRNGGLLRTHVSYLTQPHMEAKWQYVVRTSDGHAAAEPVAVGVDAAARHRHAASLAGPVEI